MGGDSGYAHKYKYRGIPHTPGFSPSSTSTGCPSSAGLQVPTAHHGEISRSGFYPPFIWPPSHTSPPETLPPIRPRESWPFLNGSSLRPRDDTRLDQPMFTESRQVTTGTHDRGSLPHPHKFPLNHKSRPRSQTTSSFRPPGVLGTQSHPDIHRPESQTTTGDLDRRTIPARRSLPSTFPAHLPPAQFAAGPPNTQNGSFPGLGQYATTLHPHPLNQSYQPQPYYVYNPLDSSPYIPIRYFLPLGHQPLSSVRYQSTANAPSYQHAQYFPPPIPESYRAQHQFPPAYNSGGHLGLPDMHQQFYVQVPTPFTDTLSKGISMQAQQHRPTNVLPPWTQHPRKDSGVFITQPTGSGCSPLLTQDSSGESMSIADTSVWKTTPLPVQGPSSPKIDTDKPGNNPMASASRTRDHSLARRPYHPNPPPNRSEWVMWVGNIPSDATHDELWRFFKDFTTASPGSEDSNGIENSGVMSVFLISRSNCIFVNYQSEEHLNRAITRFNGKKLRPHDRRCPRLVCRARRKEDDLRAGVGAQRGRGIHAHYVKNVTQEGSESAVEESSGLSSKGRRLNPPLPPSVSKETSRSDNVDGGNSKVPTRSPSSYASTSSSFLIRHFPKRFFILKSLTQFDVDLSVERGIWATQKHNEEILDQAYRTSKEVILIFSVNKSGEFYGFAQMAGGIHHNDYSISWAPQVGSALDLSSSASSQVLSYGVPESESTSRRSLRVRTWPPEPRFAATPHSQPPPSPDDNEKNPSTASPLQAKLAREPRSAPPALDRDGPSLPDQPPWTRFSRGRKTDPSTVHVPQDPRSPLTRPPEVAKNPEARASARSKGSVDGDPGNSGLHLQPVAEEARSGSSVEEYTQPGSIPVSAVAMHGHPDAQERGYSWGESFKIDWLCTERVPFYRTRHLRNPWNHNRELKVSRDGTEVEPLVGQRLIEEWSFLTGADQVTDDDAGPHASGRTGRRVPETATAPDPAGGSKGIKEEPL